MRKELFFLEVQAGACSKWHCENDFDIIKSIAENSIRSGDGVGDILRVKVLDKYEVSIKTEKKEKTMGCNDLTDTCCPFPGSQNGALMSKRL